MRTLYLCGAGNSEACASQQINARYPRWDHIVLLDDDPAKVGSERLGVPVVGHRGRLRGPRAVQARDRSRRRRPRRRAGRGRGPGRAGSGRGPVDDLALGLDEVGQPVAHEPLLRVAQSLLAVDHQDMTIRRSRIVRVRSTSSAIVATSASTPSKRDHAADPRDERDLHLHAVQLEVVAVEHVGLDPALALAVERRVGADADRGGSGCVRRRPGGAASRRTPRRRGGPLPAWARWRSGSRARGRAGRPRRPSPSDGVRAAERLGRALDVTGGQAGADVGRGPDLRAAVERDALGVEVVRSPARAASRRRRRPGRRTGSWPRPRPRRRAAPSTSTRSTNSLRRPRRDLAGERDHEHVVHTGLREQRAPASRRRSASGARARAAAPPSGAGRRSPRPRGRRPRSAGDLAGPRDDMRWPRCTPSKLPMTTTVRPRSAGHVVEGAPDPHAETTPRPGLSTASDEDGDRGGQRRRAARTARGTRRRGRTPPPGRLGDRRGRACARRARRAACSSSRSTTGSRRAPPPRSAPGRTTSASASRVWAASRVNGPDRGTAQRGQVAADAERGAQVAGDRADVGAAASSARTRPRRASPPPRRTSVDVAAVHGDRRAAAARPARRPGPGRRPACRRP